MRVNRALTLAASVVMVAGCVNGASKTQSRTPAHRPVAPPPVTAEQLDGGSWVSLPPAPIPGRDEAGAAWTGSQMLVWGGYRQVRRTCYQSFADGASYTPATRRWQMLPPAPLAGRVPAVSLWDGREFFIWGGFTATGFGHPCPGTGSGLASPGLEADGAVFSPKADRWRRLPAAPLPPSPAAQAVVWRQMVVVVVPASAGAEVAAYLPASNRWLRLPSVPARAGTYFADLELVAVGRQLLLWATWSVSQTPPVPSDSRPQAGVRLFVYQPGRHRWVLHPATGGPPLWVFAPIWTGREVLVQAGDQTCWPNSSCIGAPPSTQHGFAYQPVTNRWRALPHAPLDGLGGQQVWTGAALLAFDSGRSGHPPPGSAAAYDPSTGQWLRLPTAPYVWGLPAIVWTGRQLLIWGRVGPVLGQQARGLAFVPLVPRG